MRRDTMWGCLGVLLLVGSGVFIGYFAALVWAAPQQADARAALTPTAVTCTDWEGDTLWAATDVGLSADSDVSCDGFIHFEPAPPTPEKRLVSTSEAASLRNILNRARINARSCWEELEQVQLPSHSPVSVGGE